MYVWHPIFIIPDGLMLGSIHANGCVYVNTFVSRDLLRSTQIEAVELLDDIIETFSEINTTCDMERSLEIYHTLKTLYTEPHRSCYDIEYQYKYIFD